MKINIHPNYHVSATVTCACGNTWDVGSTRESLRTEICSKCHPFYTGQQKFVDTAGRVDKFQQRMAKTKAAREAADKKRKKKSL